MQKRNIIYTKGFINDNGNIEVPGIFFEDNAVVELAITVVPGKFEVAMLPSEITDESEQSGITMENIDNICKMYGDCTDCPASKQCMEEFENEDQSVSDRSQ